MQDIQGDVDFEVPEGYEIAGELGRGKFGIVVLAAFKGRQVALKLMSNRQAWLKEVAAYELVASFCGKDAGVVCMKDKGVTRSKRLGGLGYIAFDYVGGAREAGDFFVEKSAAAELVACSYSSLLKCFLDCARKLSALHGRGLALRDIKPQNLMLSLARGKGTFIDLGMLCVARDTPVAYAGTPYYFSPELWEGKENGAFKDTDEGFRSNFWRGNDVWGLCLTFADLLTAKHFFSRSKPVAPYPFFSGFQSVADRVRPIQVNPIKQAMLIYGLANLADPNYAGAHETLNEIYDEMAARTANDAAGLRLVESLRFAMLVEGKDDSTGEPDDEVFNRQGLRLERLHWLGKGKLPFANSRHHSNVVPSSSPRKTVVAKSSSPNKTQTLNLGQSRASQPTVINLISSSSGSQANRSPLVDLTSAGRNPVLGLLSSDIGEEVPAGTLGGSYQPVRKGKRTKSLKSSSAKRKSAKKRKMRHNQE